MRSDFSSNQRSPSAGAWAVLCGVVFVHASLGIWLVWFSQPSQNQLPTPERVAAITVQMVSPTVSNATPTARPTQAAPAARPNQAAKPSTNRALVPDAPVSPANVASTAEPIKAAAPNEVTKTANTVSSKSASAESATAAPTTVKPTASADAGVTAPRFDAAYLQNPAPSYPPLARRAGEQGKVVLQVYVEPTGSASTVQLHQSSGADRLDQSAISAVRQWKFVPAQRGSEPIGAWVLVPIVFNLKG